MKTVAVAFTGASGMPYGVRLVECLIRAGVRVWLIYSQAAQIVAKQEMDLVLPAQPREAQRLFAERFGAQDGQLTVFGRDDWNAPLASGSNPPDAYVICPCTMGTLAEVAAGMARDLVTRGADVVLKEGRKLILVPRETPFSAIHLENMLKLTRAGAVILPPNPGFYHHPQDVQGVVDFVVARILDQLGVPHQLMARWGSE
ncbi:MAG: UbiX family flavin prenyltransferase [Gammaproteobacteria bacterium]|nr:UbiX family flavin prenyltransferase [Gammaproteobacteria bacterium]MBU1647587.1 UbiX family flavin prenyltransferase [Gammaproteobacteria bacterium]MBU1971476.1 UbiX family flavin prenyltransferase [Gammaproteobacteria bacterium]